jgi:dTDP-4-amino-4,6-dideoxygalactose transaminase
MASENFLKVPFNKPYITQNTFQLIQEVFRNGEFSGDRKFTKLCEEWLEEKCGVRRGMLTPSGTAALELAALLINVNDGDEVIMPSFTFPSTANAFALRGAKIVFVDIRRDTLNIDEDLIAQAITNKTRAIVPVHYAGVACEMDAILRLSQSSNITVIADNAQGIKSTYKDKDLSSFGELVALSFHETKNIISGEGGALLINQEAFIGAAEMIREKGTDRAKFYRGEVDKYSWRSLGSSYLPNEVTAAFLKAQLDIADIITQKRIDAWNPDYNL